MVITKTITVLSLDDEISTNDRVYFVYYNAPGGPRTYSMGDRTWHDLGKPEKITVTVEAGDMSRPAEQPYETGALYEVRIMPSVPPAALWRTDYGWSTYKNGLTVWFDVHHPDLTAERIWTYDPKAVVKQSVAEEAPASHPADSSAPYVIGALYRVCLAPGRTVRVMWRTQDGWSDSGSATDWRDARWPDLTAERIWTYDPKGEVVVKRIESVSAEEAHAMGRFLRTADRRVTADLWDRYADGVERSEKRPTERGKSDD